MLTPKMHKKIQIHECPLFIVCTINYFLFIKEGFQYPQKNNLLHTANNSRWTDVNTALIR